ncbi:GNAT family N-acetyltransferase [Chitinivorax sp. B]|uniref:GNAT family N-acetyltransferase n=1 Tax=Chitinivorax sp. B TaxID=2502235 RepID=UPI0010FA361C|nr:GNAT family N-acetyltransferase [Chitinivorax sp. B]
MICITTLTTAQIDLAHSLYRQVGYRHAWTTGETLFGAWSDELLVGCVRLCQEQGQSVLRGMQVLPSHQRQGIGRRLLATLVQSLDSEICYCVPYQHLLDFYAQAGFRSWPLNTAPAFLSERVARYRSEGLSVDLMARLPE